MAKKIKLTDTQLILLTNASQRRTRSLLPAPQNLTSGGAQLQKILASLLKRELVTEEPVGRSDVAWRSEGDEKFGLFISDAGLAALNIDVGHGGELNTAQTEQGEASKQVAQPRLPMRPVTKQALVVELMSRESGASLDELVKATGWLPHSTRAALTGIRKKGRTIVAEKVEGTTRYRVASA